MKVQDIDFRMSVVNAKMCSEDTGIPFNRMQAIAFGKLLYENPIRAEEIEIVSGWIAWQKTPGNYKRFGERATPRFERTKIYDGPTFTGGEL